jgi:hypothetical protein
VSKIKLVVRGYRCVSSYKSDFFDATNSKIYPSKSTRIVTAKWEDDDFDNNMITIREWVKIPRIFSKTTNQ